MRVRTGLLSAVLVLGACGSGPVGRYANLDELPSAPHSGVRRTTRQPLDVDVEVRDCAELTEQHGVDLPHADAARIGGRAVCFEERYVTTGDLSAPPARPEDATVGVLLVPTTVDLDTSRTTVDDVLDGGGLLVVADDDLAPSVEEFAAEVEAEGGVVARPGQAYVMVHERKLDVRRVEDRRTLVLWRTTTRGGVELQLEATRRDRPSVAVEKLDRLLA